MTVRWFNEPGSLAKTMMVYRQACDSDLSVSDKGGTAIAPSQSNVQILDVSPICSREEFVVLALRLE